MSPATQLTIGLRPQPHYNQSLFSDHYLNAILRRQPAWEEAAQPAAAFLAWLRDLYGRERDHLADYNESQLEANWFRPILERLGHTWEGQPTIPGLGGGIKKPDYVLFPDDDARQTAVAAQNSRRYGLSDEEIAIVES